jgi:hypothetical protein
MRLPLRASMAVLERGTKGVLFEKFHRHGSFIASRKIPEFHQARLESYVPIRAGSGTPSALGAVFLLGGQCEPWAKTLQKR